MQPRVSNCLSRGLAFFALAAALALVFMAPAPAKAATYALTVDVTPKGGGTIWVDGIEILEYPTVLELEQGVFHSFLAVPFDNPASGVEGTFEYWSTKENGWMSAQNPWQTTFNADRKMFANFGTNIGIVEGLVWDDANYDGIRQADEAFLENWSVHLYKADGTYVRTDQTNWNGEYEILADEPGDYYVLFDVQPGWLISPRHQGGVPNTWSDPYTNPYPNQPVPGQEPGRTDAATLSIGNPGATWHAGFFYPPQNQIPNQVKTRYDQQRDLVVVDVREYAEYCAGYVPCALNHPSTNLQNTVGALQAQVGLDANIVVVSNQGVRSTLAGLYLLDYGFTNVTNMVPGMNDWPWDVVTCADNYPHSNAGPDAAAQTGDTVTLDGTGSSTQDIYSYTWTQTGGPDAPLSDPSSLNPTFVAPPAGAGGEAVSYQLQTTPFSQTCNPAYDDVTITINYNGIDNYPDDVTTFYSWNNYPLGIRVDAGGALVSLSTVDSDDYSQTTSKPDVFPYEMIQFVIKLNDNEDTAEVTFFFPAVQVSRSRWYKYDATNGWFEFGSDVWWGGNYTEYHVTFTDAADGDEDGYIRDPGGLGYYTVTPTPTPTPEPDTAADPSGNTRGCFMESVF